MSTDNSRPIIKKGDLHYSVNSLIDTILKLLNYETVFHMFSFCPGSKHTGRRDPHGKTNLYKNGKGSGNFLPAH